jgi:ribosomal protein S18 acetylase RimI-like enzyme
VKRLTFRAFEKNDAQNLADFVNAAYRGDSGRKGWTTESDILDGQRTDAVSLLEQAHDPNTKIILAEADGLLSGCFELKFESGKSVYLGMLTVSPNGQGNGIGSALLHEAIGISKEFGGENLRIQVIQIRTELIAYYERKGFKLTANRFPFPYGEPKFGIPKRPDLYFVEMVLALIN